MPSDGQRSFGRLGAMLAAVLLVTACSSTPRTTPQIDLPEPDIPAFMTEAIAGWEDAAVRSLCVDVQTEGDFEEHPEYGTPAGLVGWLAASFGVPLVSEGCDAQLTLDLALKRTDAVYGMGYRCWNGLTGQLITTLSTPGRPPAMVTRLVDWAPPEVVMADYCKKTARVSYTQWEPHVFGVLHELFGPPLWLAATLGGFSLGGYWYADMIDYEEYMGEYVGEDLVNDAVVGLLIAGVSSADRNVRGHAVDLVRYLLRWSRGRPNHGLETRLLLEPVIPYLIRALAQEDAFDTRENGEMADGTCESRTSTMRCRIGEALSAITISDREAVHVPPDRLHLPIRRERMDARADLWWEWWQKL